MNDSEPSGHRLADFVDQLPADIDLADLQAELERRLGPGVASRADDELSELAQTIATLTGGLVSIEDTASRVLAYSRSDDEVDDLRRLSILGRSGPPEYLALLREWGVYDRLASSEEVVEIAEHPESGVRRRLAVGVFAGTRQLGVIWLQQGTVPFGANAKQALLGAARLTAAQLVNRSRSTLPAAANGLAALLAGSSTIAPAQLGRTAAAPCVVAAFALGAEDSDVASRQLRLTELASIVTVHAVAFRRLAMVVQLDGRVYALLPTVTAMAPVMTLLAEAVTAVRQHLDGEARATLGTPADTVGLAAQSRRNADRALQLAGPPVLDFDAARPRLITEVAVASVAAEPDLLDPAVQQFIDADPVGAETVLLYLDNGGDVIRVAQNLRIHATTVRYRVRKSIESLKTDLTDQDHRLSLQLQLRCGLRAGATLR